MRIAILGGAFDPIHKGHLQIAKQALKKLAVDEVWFMPTASAPLKDSQCVSFADRAHMVHLAIQPYRHMRLCTLEKDLGKVSYTIDTVKALQKRYPMHSFCWLIGDDQALQFDLWKCSKEVKRLLPFYVFSRQSDVTLPEGLRRVEMPLIAVSSSEIRQGKKLYQLPKAVHRYIAAVSYTHLPTPLFITNKFLPASVPLSNSIPLFTSCVWVSMMDTIAATSWSMAAMTAIIVYLPVSYKYKTVSLRYESLAK